MICSNNTDIFKQNYILSKYKNSFPISAVCNCDCIFCSNKQNPYEIQTGKFISLETFTELVYSSNLSPNTIISLSDVVPGKRLSEGEAILHPQLNEIFNIIRSVYMNNLIEIRTNGVGVTDDKFGILLKNKPIKLAISFHSLNAQYWSQIFNIPIDKQKNVFNLLNILKKNGIKISFGIVPMPSLIGYDEIEKTIQFMIQYSKDIYFWKPGWTSMSSDSQRKMMKFDENELFNFIDKMRLKYSIMTPDAFNFKLNEKYKKYLKYVMDTHISAFGNKKLLTILTSKAAFFNINEFVKIYKQNNLINCNVEYIENFTFGGNIDCAGLLTLSDIDKIIQKHTESNNFLIPPGIYLDSFGNDLVGNNIMFFISKYNKINKRIIYKKDI